MPVIHFQSLVFFVGVAYDTGVVTPQLSRLVAHYELACRAFMYFMKEDDFILVLCGGL